MAVDICFRLGMILVFILWLFWVFVLGILLVIWCLLVLLWDKGFGRVWLGQKFVALLGFAALRCLVFCAWTWGLYLPFLCFVMVAFGVDGCL